MYRLVQYVGYIGGADCYVRDDYLTAPYETRVAALAAVAELDVHAPHLTRGLQVAQIVGTEVYSHYYPARPNERWLVEPLIGGC